MMCKSRKQLHFQIEYHRSLAKFWNDELSREGLDLNLINLWAIVDMQRAFFGFSVFEFIIDTNQKDTTEFAMKNRLHTNFEFSQHSIYNKDGYKEVVNGSSVFTNILWKRINSFKNFEFRLNTRVVRITDVMLMLFMAPSGAHGVTMCVFPLGTNLS